MTKVTTMMLLVLAIMSLGSVYAQSPPSKDASVEMIQLNLPEDMELGALVDIVSQQLKINIMIGDELKGKRISLKSPARVPKDSLYGVLQSALQIQGLMIVDTAEPGWKRIVTTRDLPRISQLQNGQAALQSKETAVTRIYSLEHIDPRHVEKMIKPFLTDQGANTIAVPEHRLLIVTDFTSNLPKITTLLQLVDQPREPVSVVFVPVEHLKAQDAAKQLNDFLLAKTKAEALGSEAVARSKIDILTEARGNRLILVGTQPQIEEARTILQSLDVDLGLKTQSYTFQSVTPERFDKIARALIPAADIDRTYRSILDNESNLLIVTTSDLYHKKLASLLARLDQPLSASKNPVRFYKLQNANAREVLDVIQSLESADGFVSAQFETSVKGVTSSENPSPAKIPNGSVQNTSSLHSLASPTKSLFGTEASDPSVAATGNRKMQNRQVPRSNVTADLNTNSIIVVADSQVQQIYEALIKRLDQRRPQVLIEITLVTIDTSDGFSLGVEISGRGSIGSTDTITFTQFGLSEVDSTGDLTLTPGLGFNGAIINANVADIIIRTLKTHARSKVISAPRLLVNDNATGTLASISESPVQSVNASDTVATTSFAGFVEAGTTITLTPRISQGDHLLLEYDFALNAFTGEGSSSLPPPRQTNSIRSTVTIPDGHTIIVGGLTRSDHSRTRSSIPLLGDIPIVGELFGSRVHTDAKTTLFVFIRPIILRDDQFRDLKYLSEYDLMRAELPSSFPASTPMLIH